MKIGSHEFVNGDYVFQMVAIVCLFGSILAQRRARDMVFVVFPMFSGQINQLITKT